MSCLARFFTPLCSHPSVLVQKPKQPSVIADVKKKGVSSLKTPACSSQQARRPGSRQRTAVRTAAFGEAFGEAGTVTLSLRSVLVVVIALLGVLGIALVRNNARTFNLKSALKMQLQPELTSGITPAPNIYAMGEGSKSWLFYDDTGIVRQLEYWLDHSAELWEAKGTAPGPHPLYINGLIKTGKSCLLKDVLPAVVAKHPKFGRGAPSEVVVLNLDLGDLPMKLGFDAMRRHLLRLIVLKMTELGITSSAIDQAKEVLAVSGADIDSCLVTGIFEELDVPILVLVDEVQNLLVPRIPGTSAIHAGAQHSAGLMLKKLMCSSSRTCLWAVTGSSMSTFWVEVSRMPPNGICALIHGCQINLPAKHSKKGVGVIIKGLIGKQERLLSHKRSWRTWKQLARLRAWAENVAMLVFAWDDYHATDHPQDMDRFLASFTQSKVMMESINEWGVLLRDMDQQQRRGFLGLAVVTEGLDMSQQPLAFLGLKKMLEPLTVPIYSGSTRRMFAATHHRAALLLLVDTDGNMRTWAQSLRLDRHIGFVDAFVSLVSIGNTVKHYMSKGEESTLWALLQAPSALMIKACGPAKDWHTTPWFQAVWFAKENQGHKATQGVSDIASITVGTAAAYQKKLQQPASLPDAGHLAWYLLLVRNKLGHTEGGLGGAGGSDGASGIGLPEPLSSMQESVDVIASSPVAHPVVTLLDRFEALMQAYAREKHGPSA